LVQLLARVSLAEQMARLQAEPEWEALWLKGSASARALLPQVLERGLALELPPALRVAAR
jgi:hypothetical protein